ncbi:MAG: nucleotidyltransferase domain-containing protein [bacterium]
MGKKKLLGIIENYRQELEKKVDVEKIILYGSYAYGKPHKGSDIDLIIISSDFKKMNSLKRLEYLSLARIKTLDPIEAIGYTPEEIKNYKNSVFLCPIMEKGKVVFKK